MSIENKVAKRHIKALLEQDAKIATKSWWISPKGEVIDIGDDTHGDYIFNNPEKFDVEILVERGEKDWAVRFDLTTEAIKKGWIRIREYYKEVAIDVQKLTSKIVDSIKKFLKKMKIPVGFDLIIDERGRNATMSGEVGDLLVEGLFDGAHEDMVDSFFERTNCHINGVVDSAKKLCGGFNNLKELISLVREHDKSKYVNPEFVPYVWLTEHCRCEKEGIDFEYPDGMEERVRKATLYHILGNEHHPEYYDPDRGKYDISQYKDRNSPTADTDATRMSDISLAEMVCDWHAMSKELGTSLKEWADKNVGKRWQFNNTQVKRIYEFVKFLEYA